MRAESSGPPPNRPFSSQLSKLGWQQGLPGVLCDWRDVGAGASARGLGTNRVQEPAAALQYC